MDEPREPKPPEQPEATPPQDAPAQPPSHTAPPEATSEGPTVTSSQAGFRAAEGAIEGEIPSLQEPEAPRQPAGFGPPKPPPPSSPPGQFQQPAAPPRQAAPPPPYPQQPHQAPHQHPQQPRPYPQQQAPGYGAPPPNYGGGYGPPPGYGGYPTPPARGRNRMLPVIAGLAVLFLVLVGGAVMVATGLSGSSMGGSTSSFSFLGERIGVLKVEGVIGEGDAYLANTATLVEQVQNWTENSSIRAIVVRINSPGGAVSATQDLYHALQEFRDSGTNGRQRPVVVSMGDISASGGYYAAMAADRVFANEGTLTGSVGVIMSFWDYQGLQEKIGMQPRTVKSGEFKDMGSGSRAMTTAEKELLEEMILDVYDQFLEAVVDGRGERVRQLLNPTNPDAVTQEEVVAHIEKYADGRIFSGRQAFEYGLVDELGTLEEAIDAAREMAGVSETTTTVEAPQRPQGLFAMTEALARVPTTTEQILGGGVRLEYRFAGP